MSHVYLNFDLDLDRSEIEFVTNFVLSYRSDVSKRDCTAIIRQFEERFVENVCIDEYLIKCAHSRLNIFQALRQLQLLISQAEKKRRSTFIDSGYSR